MHRRDRACHWCGEQPASSWPSSKVLGVAAGVAAICATGFGAWSYRAPIRDTAQLVIARVFAPGVRTENNVSGVPVATVAQVASPTEASPSETMPVDSALTTDSTVTADGIAAGTMVASASDSIQWTPAVARTWVNVRNDASRGGNVVGVINPSSRAMLGTTRAGWRLVKSTDVTGWADPRLFEPDSNRTRGL